MKCEERQKVRHWSLLTKNVDHVDNWKKLTKAEKPPEGKAKCAIRSALYMQYAKKKEKENIKRITIRCASNIRMKLEGC